MGLTIVTLVKGEADIPNLLSASRLIIPRLNPEMKWVVKYSGQINSKLVEGIYHKEFYQSDFSYFDGANQALEKIDTEYFMMIGVDDRVNFEAVEEIADRGLLRQGYDLICGSCYIESNKAVMKPDIKSILSHMVVPFPACVISTKSARSVGGFNKIYRIAGDYDLLVRLVLRGIRAVQCDEVFSLFGGGGMSERHVAEGIVEVKLSKYRNNIINEGDLLSELAAIRSMTIFHKADRLA